MGQQTVRRPGSRFFTAGFILAATAAAAFSRGSARADDQIDAGAGAAVAAAVAVVSPDGGVAPTEPSPPPPVAPDLPRAPVPPEPVIAVPSVPATPPVVEAPSATTLGAVVVTAQKREQKLQEVPVAITAVSGDTLVHSNAIKTAQDVIQYIPNASASSADGRTRPRWFLRGIGTNETAASTVSPIGIYNDDVFLNNVYLQAFPLFDVERVEVLRGPQGTLWGKNTTGGAIHFVSKKPGFATDGYARLGLGSFHEKLAQGGLGGAIVPDLVAARVAFYTEKRDGWVFNEATGKNFGALFDAAARAQLLITPGDHFEAHLVAKIRRLDAEKNPRFRITNPVRAEDLKNPVYAGPLRTDAISQEGISQDLFDSDGVSAKLNGYFGGYTLTSITAYDRGKRIDLGGSSIGIDIGRTRAYTLSRQATEELRLTSPTADRISWIAGAYYFYETLGSSSAERQDAVPGASPTSPSPTASSRAGFAITDYKQKTTSFAPFASVTAKLLDDLTLIGGLRWSTEKKEFELLRLTAPTGFSFNNNASRWWLPTAVSALNDPLSSARSNSWQELTYDATVQYKITKDLNVYVRYAHGFRAGGYVVAGDYSITQLEPETLNATEIGVKSQWLDGQLTFNSAFFNYDYQDIIVGVLLPIPGTTMTRQVQENAAAGYSRGAEFEATWQSDFGLRLQGSVGLLHTKYTDYSSDASGEKIEANGNRFTRAPAFSGTVDLEYSLPLPGEDSLGVGTDWSFRTRQYFNAVNQTDPTLWQDAYPLGNGRLFYRRARGRLELSAYVRNATDRVYSILSTGPANGQTSQVYGLPRTFGGSLYVRF